MARPVDKKLRLKHIMEVEAGVDADIVKWMMEATDGPQLECPADLAKLWTDATCKDGPITDVLGNQDPKIEPARLKGRKLVGRLQTAWDYAKADHTGAAEKLSEPAPADTPFEDAPWPEDRKASCGKAVRDAYGGLTFDMGQVPNDLIMNRLDRMWRDKKTTLLQLDKMRCQADHELILCCPAKGTRVLVNRKHIIVHAFGAP